MVFGGGWYWFVMVSVLVGADSWCVLRLLSILRQFILSVPAAHSQIVGKET